MFLQPTNPNKYDSVQQLATKVAILRGRLNLMRMDHPDRAALVTEFATLQGQLTLLREGVQHFGTLGFTF
ncbi:MAG: hypothetical protein ACRYFZ_03685 [Janthinobacterium lividum]